jgi:hypothetical protein
MPRGARPGAEHPRAIYSEEDVRRIRRMAADGLDYSTIAARVGGDRKSVGKVARGERYPARCEVSVDGASGRSGERVTRWWNWHVGRQTPGGYEPLADGVSWESREQAEACARAVARVYDGEEGA